MFRISLIPMLAGFASLSSAPVSVAAYEFQAVYTADLLRNASGGIATGTRYLDNLDLMLEIDVEDAWEFGTGTLFVYGLYNNSTTFSDELIGDLLVNSNIDAPQAWRLYEFWYEFRRDAWSVRSGLYDLNSEFDVNTAGTLFINSAHGIGSDLSQTGENGPGIFPVSSLTVRAAYETPLYTIRMAVLDGVPGDPADPSSNDIALSAEDGVLFVGEMEAAVAGSARMRAGYWRYSAEFESPFDGHVSRNNDGWYVGGEYESPLGEGTAAFFIRYGRANELLNNLGEYVGGGVVIQGLVPRRPDDRMGMAVASGRTGEPFRQYLERTGADPASHETAWELTYRARISDHVAIQPDVQFVQNPGGLHRDDDAWVVGLRVEVSY